jgi:hypothetical protein
MQVAFVVICHPAQGTDIQVTFGDLYAVQPFGQWSGANDIDRSQIIAGIAAAVGQPTCR